jgi:hypothetical protein
MKETGKNMRWFELVKPHKTKVNIGSGFIRCVISAAFSKDSNFNLAEYPQVRSLL